MRVQLLSVEDVFDLPNQGLVCAPFFRAFPNEQYKNFSAVVTVQPPNGASFEIDAYFELTHFKILDLTAPVERCWQVLTCLGNISKDSVPVGSLIFCDSEVKKRLSS